MRLPTPARSSYSLIVVLATALLAACSGDATAPDAPREAAPSVPAAFVPTEASKALVGVKDGTYEFTVEPRKSNTLYLGANALYIPAKAICDRETSSYGAGHWDEPCELETKRFKITAVVKNANSSHPSIDFQPALRFAPDAKVMLYFYVPNGSQASTKEFTVEYCNDDRVCVDESLLDSSLTTYFNDEYDIVFRRIKHFSGFIVVALTEEVGSLLY